MREFPPRVRTPVIRDVARLAGVSHQTVSRVLNAHARVSPATRARVETAIFQLGYRPNKAARELASRQSRTLGLISVDTTHYGPSQTLFAIEEAARDAGYFLTLATLRTVDRANMRAAFDHLMQAAVDGVVVLAPVVAASEALHAVSPGVPVVEIQNIALTGASGAIIDEVTGARLATRHLLELGHHSVAHISGPGDWPSAQARIQGWRAELDEARRAAGPLVPGDWSAASGYEAAQQLVDNQVTAVFAANDQMALGLLHAMRERDLTAPRDLSLVGFDDIPEAAYFAPPLTTMRQDFAEVGRRAIARILSAIEGEEPPLTTPMQPTLVVRQSTGEYRAR